MPGVLFFLHFTIIIMLLTRTHTYVSARPAHVMRSASTFLRSLSIGRGTSVHVHMCKDNAL